MPDPQELERLFNPGKSRHIPRRQPSPQPDGLTPTSIFPPVYTPSSPPPVSEEMPQQQLPPPPEDIPSLDSFGDLSFGGPVSTAATLPGFDQPPSLSQRLIGGAIEGFGAVAPELGRQYQERIEKPSELLAELGIGLGHLEGDAFRRVFDPTFEGEPTSETIERFRERPFLQQMAALAGTDPFMIKGAFSGLGRGLGRHLFPHLFPGPVDLLPPKVPSYLQKATGQYMEEVLGAPPTGMSLYGPTPAANRLWFEGAIADPSAVQAADAGRQNVLRSPVRFTDPDAPLLPKATARYMEEVEGYPETGMSLYGPTPAANRLWFEGAAAVEDVTGVALTKAKPGVRGAIRSALERLGLSRSPAPLASGRELGKIEAMWAEGSKPASRDFTDAYLKIQEYANDTYFGLRRLQTQVGKHKPIEAGGQYDLINLLTRGPGAANAGATRYALAIEEIKGLGSIAVNDVNTIIFAEHGKFILAEKGAKRVLPGGLKSADELDAAIAQLRARLSPEQFDQAEAGARVIQRIYQEERVRLAQAGFITDELAVDLAKRYPWYNPLKYVAYMDAQWRVGKSTKPFTVLSSGFRRLTEEGTEEAIRGPLEVLGEQLIQNEVRIQKNATAKAIIKLALEDPSLGVKKVSAVRPVALVEGKPVFRPVGGDLPGTLSFFENGKRQIYKVPDFIDREAIMLNESMRHPVASLIGSLNGISRAAFTSYSPPFVVANMLNDMLTVFLTRGILPPQTVKKLTESLRGLEKDPGMQSFRLAGGYQMRFFGRSAEQIAREVGASGGQIVGTGPSFLTQLKKAIPKAGELGEQSTRMAVYNKALDKTLPNWRSMTPEAVAATPQARVAAASSVESTINFARGGYLIKGLNPFVIFLNAAMEGTKLPFRALRENAGTRWKLAGVGAGQVGLTAYNMSYPEYFDIPIDIRHGSGLAMLPSREKDIYGNPKANYLTFVPRTREWGFFFAPITYAMERMFGDNPTEFGEFARSLIPQLSPLNEIPSPIAMAEMFEQAFNYDLFRSQKIVPTEMQTLPTEEQVMPWTSRTIQQVANTVGISPIRLQHGFSGILGGAGRTFTSVTDYILNSLMPREVSPEIQALVERYEALETPTERRSMVQELPPDQRKAMFNELRQPDPSIPVVSPIVGRVYRDRGGQLRLTREEQAGKETGISPEQTRQAGSFLQKVSDERLTMQQQLDSQLRDDTLPPEQRISPKAWRIERRNFSHQYKGVLLGLGIQFPGAAQIHKDRSVKTSYYDAITALAGSIADPRMRGQAIAAGWYAITAEGPEGTIGLENVGVMFDERDQYRAALSPGDRLLLNAELESRMTPVEREYSRDIEVIRQSGYWNINDEIMEKLSQTADYEDYNQSLDQSHFLDTHPLLKSALSIVREQKLALRSGKDEDGMPVPGSDPEYERLLFKWGYITKPVNPVILSEYYDSLIRQKEAGVAEGAVPLPVGQ